MQPIVKPLSIWQRKLVFGTLLLAFILSLPIFIFYATGYRYDFSERESGITATGGFYILADANNTDIYIDDEIVTNARAFRDAFYIQGLEPGLRNIHVQGPGLNTWVKELMIYPHIVTEVESFNLPLLPRVRLVPEYTDVGGEAVFFAKSSSTPVLLSIATTSTPFRLSTSTATTTLRQSPEFVLLQDLFIEKASTTASMKRQAIGKEEKPFGFSTTSKVTTVDEIELATTTVVRDKLALVQKGDDVFALALSSNVKDVPRYFCINQTPVIKPVSPEELFEDKKLPAEQLLNDIADEQTTPCRAEIRIDRKWQTVHGFDFFPANGNLVIMHLDDGIYVVEIDDRSWQNTQLLYPGSDLELLLYRDGIFVRQNGLIFEVLPEIASV
ncbi:MAG: hypothetical protein R3B53_02080 [Candidatus Paceibacterota bacterium]